MISEQRNSLSRRWSLLVMNAAIARTIGDTTTAARMTKAAAELDKILAADSEAAGLFEQIAKRLAAGDAKRADPSPPEVP